jgi:hypothetical protein
MGKTKTESSTKPTKVKVPYIHACVFYGGIIKTGYCVVKVTKEAPEILYASLKEYYGEEEEGFRGKYVRCTKPIETVISEINEKLEDKKISEMAFNYNSSEVVKIMKEVCDVSKCKTMGVYTNEDSNKKANVEDSDDEKSKKTSSKKAKSDDDDEEEAEKPKKKASTKKATKAEESDEEEKPKKSTKTKDVKDVKDAKDSKETKESKKKVTKVESDEDEDLPKKATKSKSKEIKETKDTKSKSKKVKAKVESDDEDDAIPTSRGNKTIIISDDESSEEEN